jgi:glucose-1-phosphate thymidylyltransferase
MRALVLAGGEGSRLRPLTHTQAKQLIPVAGQPILFHALDAIRDAGITEVGIVIGHTGPEVRAAVGDGARWHLSVTYLEQEAPLGLAHAVMTAADFVRGQPFLMYLGDNVLLEGVRRFVSEFERTRPDAQIFVARVSEPEHFGVVELKDGNAVRLVEKPRGFVSDLALVGVYLFDDSILEACATLSPSWRGEYEITEAIQWLIDQGKTVRVEMLDGWWKDTGRPEDLLEANRMLLAARQGLAVDGVMVAPDAQVSDSQLIGPVVIGPGCRIEGSSIGPDVSLEAGCTVIDSTIRDSIVMEGCSVSGVESLERSILGRNVEVRHSVGRHAHRLVVGDQSVVEVD